MTLGVAATAGAAPDNLIANPSGVGGSTKGWSISAGGAWGTLTAERISGQWWLHWLSTSVATHSPNAGSGWTVYYLSGVTPGETVSCTFEATGSGTIVEDLWTGSHDHFSTPVALSATPQTLTLTETIDPKPWANTPQEQMRYNGQSGDLNIYWNDAACLPGGTVALDAAGQPAATPKAPAKASPTSPLPTTGLGPLPAALGSAALLGGAALMPRRRRRRS